MPLVELHEEDPKRRNAPVFVNSEFVTFIQKSPTSSGTIVGLVGDDLGCVVRESVAEVAGLVSGANAQPEITPMPAESPFGGPCGKYVLSRIVRDYGHASDANPEQEKCTAGKTVQTEAEEVRKPRKARKWHSRKPFSKEGE